MSVENRVFPQAHGAAIFIFTPADKHIQFILLLIPQLLPPTWMDIVAFSSKKFEIFCVQLDFCTSMIDVKFDLEFQW